MLSQGFDLGTNNDNAYNIRAFADYDGDGLMDVAFCRWPEPLNIEERALPGGVLHVIGYRDGGWYQIPVRALSEPCDVLK
jgi:hypothetical protein